MKIRTITISSRRKVFLHEHSLDKFDATPCVELTADLEEGDDLQACAKDLRLEVESMVAQHVQEIRDTAAARARIEEANQQPNKLEIDREAKLVFTTTPVFKTPRHPNLRLRYDSWTEEQVQALKAEDAVRATCWDDFVSRATKPVTATEVGVKMRQEGISIWKKLCGDTS